MPHVTVSNVADLWVDARRTLKRFGVWSDSRVGKCLQLPEPVIFTIRHPYDRCLPDPIRDANPFFTFFEALWVLNGENSIDFLAQFVPRVKDYSDDGATWRGAYGYRLRRWFGRDQIQAAIDLLRTDRNTRHAVLGIWDPGQDGLGAVSKDHPCNDMVLFRVRGDALDMTVYNRSNDVVWGLCPGNAFVFSMLQEYVACRAGLQVGKYHHVSNALHLYHDTPKSQVYLEDCRYAEPLNANIASLQADDPEWDNDLARLFETDGQLPVVASAWWHIIALPMVTAWSRFKQWREVGRNPDKLPATDVRTWLVEPFQGSSVDIHVWARQWLERRLV